MNTVLNLKSNDIRCAGCKASIERVVNAIGGVEKVNVDVDTQSIQVSLRDSEAEPAVRAAIQKAGFSLEN
jgi:copper chaperone CopZ